MLRILLCLMLFSGVVNARELVCQQYGYTNNPDNFHKIVSHPQVTIFHINEDEVVVGDNHYRMIDPSSLDMEGLAKTFYRKKTQKALYLYTSPWKTPQVGISRVAVNSDAGFEDKALYSKCAYLSTGGSNGLTESSFDPQARRAKAALPTWRF